LEYRKLGNTGMEVSVLNFGASSLGGVFEPVNPDQCIETVRAALDGGINFIDVSPAYGEALATILSFCHYELNDNSLADLIPYLKEKGVGIINASPTGMGLLTPQGVPAWHPASKAIVEGCRKAVEHCKARGVNIVKLAVHYSCSHPDIATTLVGTAHPDAIRDNIAYVQAPMDEKLVAEVLEVLKPIHRFNFTRGRPEHRDPLLGS
jgi:aryl-alcohol dehydrogenase-like predicted oxidoreductase